MLAIIYLGEKNCLNFIALGCTYRLNAVHRIRGFIKRITP